MTSSRKTALAVGVLFILTFVTSIAAVFAYGPVLSDPLYIVGAGADTGVFLGAFLELLLIITNIGCAVVLFPLLKRQNEGLALGYVTARLVECGFIAVGLLSLLTVATLQEQTTSANAASLVPIGTSLVAMHNWTFLLGPGFADGIGTGLILGWLMYRSGLVGRRMALVGVVGGAMLATSGAAVLLGVIPQGGAVQGIATIPEIIWEAFLGLYLLFKDFKPSPVLAPESREQRSAGLRRRRPEGPGAGLRGPSPARHRIGSRPHGRREDARHDQGRSTRRPRADASDPSAVPRSHRLDGAPRPLPAQRGSDRPLATGGRQQVRDDAPHDARATVGPAAGRDRRLLRGRPEPGHAGHERLGRHGAGVVAEPPGGARHDRRPGRRLPRRARSRRHGRGARAAVGDVPRLPGLGRRHRRRSPRGDRSRRRWSCSSLGPRS